MRRLLLSALFCLFTAISTQADPFVILPNGEFAFTTTFSTQGTFSCTLCTGSGTNSVVFGSGANTLTITFTGVDSTILVSGESQTATLGQFQVTATGSGFVFPQFSNTQPLVTFNLAINQSSPIVGGGTRPFVAMGGDTSLTFVPFLSDHVAIPTGPNPFSYTHIVYTFSPFTIPNTSGIVILTAEVVAVPEPASVLLLSSGVGLMLSVFRKRFPKH